MQNDTYKTARIEEALSRTDYPGRGIIIGRSPDGSKAMTAYFIMGRSDNSKNRVFREEGDDVVIYPYDYSKVEDPSLIIYSPVRRYENSLIITNGDQTDTIYDHLALGKDFREALRTRAFEPDRPNWTPRISGILNFTDPDLKGEFTYEMSILKSVDSEGTGCARYFYEYPSVPGLGHFIHTYEQNGDPIPTFRGEPERVSMPEDLETFSRMVWESLDEGKKISMYATVIDLKTGVRESELINKNI